MPWLADDAPMDADMWATADETRKDIVEFHQYSAQQSDTTIELLPLDSPGEVPWWPAERRRVTLHQILVHMCVETARTPVTRTFSANSSMARRVSARTIQT